uniref:Endonuclease n=1 Tax=Dulem virus 36 TaxID=3145754 RepID=A0AAU8AZD9_9CAUD
MKVKQVSKLKGFEHIKDCYYVSDTGRVFSLSDYKNGILPVSQRRELKQYEKTGGYLNVALVTKHSKVNYIRVNRLVARAFVKGETAKRKYVNHKDENRKNNNADNLMWVTPKENNRWSLVKTVFCYDLEGNYIKYYDAVADTKEDGFNISHVANVCRGIARQHKGYLFTYEYLTKEQAIQRLSNTHYVRYPKCNGSK